MTRLDEIKALQAENEELKARVVMMSDAIEKTARGVFERSRMEQRIQEGLSENETPSEEWDAEDIYDCMSDYVRDAFKATQPDIQRFREEIRLAETERVFSAICEVIEKGGSFRKLIYDYLDFPPSVYEPLYRAGGMAITNFICDAQDKKEVE